MAHTLKGGCHCGAISLEFESQEPALVPRICSCGFCRRHGAIYVSDPAGALRITFKQDDAATRYVFGQGTAEFLVCKRCGVMSAALSEIDGVTYGIVNANVLEDFTPGRQDATSHDYEDETNENRLARRKKNWIGRVIIGAGES